MKIIHLEQTDSTNLYLERRFSELPSICSVRAEIQTDGRGRLSRHWASAKGGLWFSVLFKSPSHSPSQLQKICSLATLDVLSYESKTNAFALKWPNDIYYQSKKISGCLQKNLISSASSSCIIGIGVNVNNPLPEELTKKAINLKAIVSQEINVEKLYQHILEKIERQLSNFSQQQLEIEYRKHLLIKTGVHVKVLDVINNKQHTGRVIGYPGETIEIETEEGKRLSFSAADVTLKSWED